jgi:muramoyltetrapeptide carboxypeptidase
MAKTDKDMKTDECSWNGRSLLVPSPVAAGDTIGVVATSGPTNSELLDRGLLFLQSKGFRVVQGCNVGERNGAYLAGTDEQRCMDLNAMLQDPEIRAVLFARGGYGVMRLLDQVDTEGVRQDPKLLLGMSDLTALQLSLFARVGLASWSGPMVAGQVGEGLDELSEAMLLKALTLPVRGRELLPDPVDGLRVPRSGVARGVLLGGCLSLITSIVGTPHFPDLTNGILIIEDVHEPLYRVDRMLTQLKLAGVLGKVSGIVVGHVRGLEGRDLLTETEQRLLELTSDHPVPILSGFPYGHVLPNVTVPLGVPVRVDTEIPSLTVDM